MACSLVPIIEYVAGLYFQRILEKRKLTNIYEVAELTIVVCINVNLMLQLRFDVFQIQDYMCTLVDEVRVTILLIVIHEN